MKTINILIATTLLLTSQFVIAKSFPLLTEPLKSPANLSLSLKWNPQLVQELANRKNSGSSGSIGAELKRLDLSDIDKAVNEQFMFLRAMYFESLVRPPIMEYLASLTGENSIFNIHTVNSYALSMDMTGQLVLDVTTSDDSKIYTIAEKLAKNKALLSLLGGTRFTISHSVISESTQN